MINGETGEVEWQDTLGFLSFATANAIDADGDGKDEVIMSLNYAGATFSHELLLIDFNDQTTTSLTGLKPSTNLASTPWAGRFGQRRLARHSLYPQPSEQQFCAK